MKENTFEELVQRLELKVVEVIDQMGEEPVKKYGFVGFESFKAAFDIARKHHKRLEVISRKDDAEWLRLHVTTFENLDIKSVLKESRIEDDSRYKICFSRDEYSKISAKLLKNIIETGGSAKEYAEFVEEIEATKKLFKKNVIGYQKGFIVFDLKENKQFGPIVNDTMISFKGNELAICLMDVDDGTVERLAPRVYAGDVIPCLSGQMPEDFIGRIPEQHPHDSRMMVIDHFSPETAPNPDNSLMMGPFLVFDSDNEFGYAYRNTYDGKVWRWEGLQHTNFVSSPFPTLEEHIDHEITGWSLPPVGVKLDSSTSFISDSPVPFVPESAEGIETIYYKNLAESKDKELEELKASLASNEPIKAREEQIRKLQQEVKSLNEEKSKLLDRCILAETDRDDYKRQLEQAKANTSDSGSSNNSSKPFHFTRSLRNIVINNGEVWVNGQRVTKDDMGNVFVNNANYDIHVQGNADNIKTTSGDVTISGSANSVNTASGDVEVRNNVQGSVNTASGDITVGGNVNGNCSTMSGNIRR